MRKFTIQFTRNGLKPVGFFLFLFLFFSSGGTAQRSKLITNTNTPLTTDRLSGITVGTNTIGGFGSAGNIIDANLGNAATWGFVIGGSAYIEVTDAGATGAEVFPAGSVAGFVVANASLTLIGNITISTYLGGNPVESKSGSSLLKVSLLGGSDQSEISFVTTQSYDRIRITFTSIGIGSQGVYYAFIKKLEEGPELPCNTNTPMAAPDYPAVIDRGKTGTQGIAVTNMTDLEKVIDGYDSTYATVNIIAGILNGSASVAVKDALTDYEAGTYVGFDISSSALVGLGILNDVTVETYLNDVLQETESGTALVANAGLLSSSGRSTVGFITTKPVDEVRLVLRSGVASLNLGSTRVYSAVFKRFCEGAALDCNMPQILSAPDYPVYVDGRNTGIIGAVNAGTMMNWDYAIDHDSTTYATINLTADVLGTATFAIGNALTVYPANTFAGIDISTGILTASVLEDYRIELLRNGSVVQTSPLGGLLVNVGTPLLTGTNRQTIGIVSNTDFDEIKLVVTKPVNVDLGVIHVHGAKVEKLCAVPLVCSETILLQHGVSPAIISAEHTGILGAVNAGSEVKNPDYVLDPDNSKYAEITTVAGVLSDASISVKNPLQEYPAGLFAGYVVESTTGVLQTGLFNSITISTYNGGVLQESRTGNTGLFDLTLLVTLSGPGSFAQNIGFVTTKPFDEIQISLGRVVSVIADLKVYGAFADTRTASGGSLLCSMTAPDFNVTYINVEVPGNVSTNDVVPAGTVYGTPVPDGGNPNTTDMLNMNPNGGYTFTPTQTGVYKFEIPVCLAGGTDNCLAESLTINVIDPGSTTNLPVVNPDVVSLQGNDTNPVAVNVPVKANDGPGNPGGTLGIPTISNGPGHGSATVNSEGEVVYTPDASYYGNDTLTYQVCESPSNLCSTADVILMIWSPDASNSTFAADDYVSSPEGVVLSVPASEGILANDSDPEGDAQTAVAKTETIPGKGKLVLLQDGSYTFTPEAGFRGPVEFETAIVDAGNPVATAKSTLHILVTEAAVPDLTPRVFFRPAILTKSGVVGVLVDIYEFNGFATQGQITVLIERTPTYTLSFDNTATSISNQQVNNAIWQFDTTNPNFYILTTNQTIGASDLTTFGLTAQFNTNNKSGKVNVVVSIKSGSGGEQNSSNNKDTDSLNYLTK